MTSPFRAHLLSAATIDMSIAFAPRFARAATPAVKRCFATNGALMSFQRAPQSTTPAKSTTEAPRAPSPNPLQSSHAQGGSASTSSSLSPEESSSSDFSSNGNGSGSLPTDWSTSFSGLGSQPFDARIAELLTAPIDAQDVEIKPDGIIFLPEIKYRRVLNRAFGPGGWGLAPRGPEKVDNKTVSREYALVCMGQYVRRPAATTVDGVESSRDLSGWSPLLVEKTTSLILQALQLPQKDVKAML